MLTNQTTAAALCVACVQCSSIPNSVDNGNGTCVCTQAPFTVPATNMGVLESCLNSTLVQTSGCPAAFPVPAKTADTTPVTVQCVSTASACPAGYPLAQYSGNPSVRQECRPGANCNFNGFSMIITDASGAVIGCVNPASGACPFVATRLSPNWSMQSCSKITSCSGSVPALATDGTLIACLVLGSNQACPDVAGLSFPIEVTYSAPTTPTVCGGSVTCTNSTTISCLAVGSTCPAAYSWTIFNSPGGNITTTPVLAECRFATTNCTLTAAGMSAANPNAGSYQVNLMNGDQVAGCLRTDSKVCPPGYPIAITGEGRVVLLMREQKHNFVSSNRVAIPQRLFGSGED